MRNEKEDSITYTFMPKRRKSSSTYGKAVIIELPTFGVIFLQNLQLCFNDSKCLGFSIKLFLVLGLSLSLQNIYFEKYNYFCASP